MMACEHSSHPLWAGIKCSQCGRWYDECRTCGKRGCEECMKAGLKQAWENYQEALKEFECPRCGHCCKQEEQKLRRLHAANQELLEALKQCAVLIHGGNRQGDAAITAARAVIAKAEGA